MKKMKLILSAFLLLCSIAVAQAQQIEKVVGTIAGNAAVGRFGPDASDFYGFQTYNRGLNIDASGSEFENLVLKIRVYIDNIDNPGDISFIEEAGFAMIELANEQTPVDTYVQWGIKTLGLKHGWTDLYLPLTTGDRKANFDLAKPINWFRFGFARIPGEPDALQIHLRDVQLVDKSVLVDPPCINCEVWNDTYLVADLPYTMNMPLANGKTFSVGQSFDPVDASEHNPQQLYLKFDANITEQTPGDMFILSKVAGQIELTSSGHADMNEMLWGIGSVDWKPGQHTYTLPFSTGGKTGGDLDLAAINFIRFYAVNVPADYTGQIQLSVSNVQIVDNTTLTKLPALFADKMIFQQNKPVKIWGSATEGKEITVDFYNGDTKIDTETIGVTESGKWEVTFDAQPASYDKYRIEVLEGETLIQSVNDILVGEVWLSSGQSNMALNVAGTIDGQTLMANATNDNIRFFLEPTATSAPYQPNTDIAGAYWGSGNDGMRVGSLSAVAYSMAVKLQEELDIPVGIINTAVGSSVIEAWLSVQALDTDPALVQELKRLGLYFDEEFYPTGTNQMSSYYNLKIHPLSGYNIAGMIWYQGESNSPRPQLYAQEVDLLKESYGKFFGFNNDDMPFIYCQVAPWIQTLENPQYLAPLAEGFYDGWAMNPETMSLLPIYDTDLTYVGNVVIHPTNKTPIGKRFATAALNMVYNGEGEYTAAIFDGMTISGDSIIVKFAHAGDGLKSINGIDNIRGFAVCGEDGVFVGAEARIISENEVVVWNNRVKNPVQVTYAWASFNVISNLANSVDIPAAPFRSDRNEGYKFYNPQDWTFADGDIWVINGEEAGFFPAWANAPVSGIDATLTYDSENKSEGKASLKVEYAEAGTVGAGPVISYRTTVNQMANFNTISVDVLNTDDREKTVELLIKGADGKTYKATVAGSETQETAATIGKTASFSTLAFDIKTLKDEQGVIVPENNTATVLTSATAIQVTVTDNAAGSIYIDNVLFGLSTEGAPLSIEEEAIGDMQLKILLQDNTLSVKTATGNPVQKIELIDMQGRTVYSNDNIHSTEYSFEVASLQGLYIAKIQSDKLTSSQKIMIN